MQNIHVKRYEAPTAGYLGSIEPEDRSWIVFVAADGTPSLWERAECVDENGATVSGYAPAIPKCLLPAGEAE